MAVATEQDLGIDPALDLLDALVQRLDGVVGQHGHGFLGEDRALVDLEAGDVDGAAGDLHAVLERVGYRVPALERGQQGRVGVHDLVGVGVVDRLLEDGAEARHGQQVEVVTPQGLHHAARCRRPGRTPSRSRCARRSRPAPPPPGRCRWRHRGGRRAPRRSAGRGRASRAESCRSPMPTPRSAPRREGSPAEMIFAGSTNGPCNHLLPMMGYPRMCSGVGTRPWKEGG